MESMLNYTRVDVGPPTKQPSTRQIFLAAAATCLGWAFDLYDLLILLYVAPVVGRLFFPFHEPLLSLAAVFASFAVTLVMRPVGAAVFGSFADRRGRKGALTLAVSMVGVTTFLLGALPTIRQIGPAAPLIFLMLRLIQGVFMGGVTACTGTVGVEAVPERWRGLMSGLVGGGGGGIGGMLAAAVFWVTTSSMSNTDYEQWGWRILFFTSILSSLIGLCIARKLNESTVSMAIAGTPKSRGSGRPEQRPLRLLFSAQYFPVFLANLPLIVAAGAGYYLTSGYLPSYLKVALHLPNDRISVILSVASVTALLASLSLGHLSQIFGRRSVFIGIGAFRLIALPTCALMMTRTDSLLLLCLLAALFASCGNAAYAPLLAFLNERFPTALRASGVGLSWSIGFALGGMAPTFTVLAAHTSMDLPVSLVAFLIGTSVLYIAGALVIPETRGRISADQTGTGPNLGIQGSAVHTPYSDSHDPLVGGRSRPAPGTTCR
jgi:MFS transporter, MHS family, proline/betaine transporter